ncbi:unnamed protein product [Darwinula stevensoni]|uniref:Glycosyltransferase 2-like domain-containing protein n=1 Tax=Darwinula stevensoni TaxID=69355 RepID=A0A7R9A225_9CRUS|nr:unnamed protein product [Darwinula stevensoni]CAG0878993.1 unnamed protein product [Darwinula stevensoni]
MTSQEKEDCGIPLCVNDRVVYIDEDEVCYTGTIQWIGDLEDKEGLVGVQFDSPLRLSSIPLGDDSTESQYFVPASALLKASNLVSKDCEKLDNAELEHSDISFCQADKHWLHEVSGGGGSESDEERLGAYGDGLDEAKDDSGPLIKETQSKAVDALTAMMLIVMMGVVKNACMHQEKVQIPSLLVGEEESGCKQEVTTEESEVPCKELGELHDASMKELRENICAVFGKVSTKSLHLDDLCGHLGISKRQLRTFLLSNAESFSLSSDNKYKDFFCGVFFASATWTLLIILYFDSVSFKEKQKNSGSRLRLVARYERPKLELGPQNQNSPFIVNTSDPGFIHNERDFEFRQEGYKKYAFNALISERIGEFRDIPDTRHVLCKTQKRFLALPATTVVICFYNEAKSVLVRTVTTVIRRTSSDILQGIILVDDCSDDGIPSYYLMVIIPVSVFVDFLEVERLERPLLAIACHFRLASK